MSVGSEATMTGLPQDDSSNDGLLIVDDLPPQQSTLQQQPALQPAGNLSNVFKYKLELPNLIPSSNDV